MRPKRGGSEGGREAPSSSSTSLLPSPLQKDFSYGCSPIYLFFLARSCDAASSQQFFLSLFFFTREVHVQYFLSPYLVLSQLRTMGETTEEILVAE